MPTDEIPELTSDQLMKIIKQALTARSFKGKSQQDTQPLIAEINVDFAKTMNRIIFDKHMRGRGKDLIGGGLQLPPAPRPRRPYYGMIQIPSSNLPDVFTGFCFASILTRVEAIKAGERINEECLEAQEKEIFNTNLTKTLKLDDFMKIENSSISQCGYYLRETWVSKIQGIVIEKFQGAKDWFNLGEKIPEVYNRGKLKKFLTLVRVKMQETLLCLFEKSFHKYVNTLRRFVPKTCTVIAPAQIQNEYEPWQLDSLGHEPFPLFTVELMAAGKPEEMPTYSQDPKKLVEMAQVLYDRGIDEMQQLPQVEPKVMQDLFKGVVRAHLRAPFRPLKKPASVTRNDKKELEDNAWLDENYERLREELSRAVEPMAAYKELYKQYKEEFMLSIDEEKTKLNDKENPMTAQELKRYINKHREMEKLLQREIPDHVQVSVFLVECREMRRKLAQNHADLVREAKETLKERARSTTALITEAFDAMKNKIKKLPTSIEDLTNIRSFISSEVPGLLDKQRLDIEKMMEAYDILDEYMEKLSREELNTKWSAFRKPKELLELIEDQKGVLMKKEETLYAGMQGQQTEFKEELTKIEEVVAGLKSYMDIKQYEEAARKTQSLREKIKECKEREKTFNHRESLLNKQATDYAQLRQIEKDFVPYDNLWTTADKWFKSKHSWHHDRWEKLDAQAMENIVSDSSRLMSQTSRAFKEMPAILKIAEAIKEEVEQFKRYVPLAVALRTEGLKERHWDEISQQVHMEVRPKEGFTMTTVINLNLIDSLAEIEKVAEK